MSNTRRLGVFLTLLTLIFSYGCTADVSSPVMASPPANAVWIDVRTAEEYAGGHVDEASNIPYEIIIPGVETQKLAKDTPIYLYCRSGHRAGVAKESLEAQHYTNVINVGGLEDARSLLAQSKDP